MISFIQHIQSNNLKCMLLQRRHCLIPWNYRAQNVIYIIIKYRINLKHVRTFEQSVQLSDICAHRTRGPAKQMNNDCMLAPWIDYHNRLKSYNFKRISRCMELEIADIQWCILYIRNELMIDPRVFVLMMIWSYSNDWSHFDVGYICNQFRSWKVKKILVTHFQKSVAISSAVITSILYCVQSILNCLLPWYINNCYQQ